MIKRALIIVSVILAGVIGYTVAYQQLSKSNSPISQAPLPKYTQQQIADMQAELEEIETALRDNDEQQKDTEEKISSYEIQHAVACVFLELNYRPYGVDPQSTVNTSIQLKRETRAKLQELRAQHQELFERKILLMVKLEATQ